MRGVGKKHENLSPKSAKTRQIRHRRQDCRPRSQFSILFQYLCFKMSLEERGIYHQIVQFFLLIYNIMQGWLRYRRLTPEREESSTDRDLPGSRRSEYTDWLLVVVGGLLTSDLTGAMWRCCSEYLIYNQPENFISFFIWRSKCQRWKLCNVYLY